MRLNSIDTISVFGIFAVICIHLQTFRWGIFHGSPPYEQMAFFINQGARFAVPFFFASSGYYYGKILGKGVEPLTLFLMYARKLIYIFLAWSIVYALVPGGGIGAVVQQGLIQSVAAQLAETFKSNPLSLAWGGTKYHLWFIMALLTSFFIVSVSVHYRWERYLPIVAILLYAVAMLGGSYSRTPIGISLPFNPRNGPFSGTLFVVAGWWFSSAREEGRPNPTLAILLVLIGFFLHFTEIILLKKYYGVDLFSCDFLLGTMLLGCGCLMLALSYPEIGKGTPLPDIGRLTLGMYIVHPLVIILLANLNHWVDGSLWEVSKPVVVFVVSIMMADGLNRHRITQKMLT